ncbi:DUF3592 domain-containing protein [Pontixanthobacter aquaemixtae]|uniref:DUF3592 domain-containing protein n=1 Tax=Pontixanthobacter aquaemixtae TaxID=1958940 RepID=A0A844ZTJ2_9SPHN|nr:DUF3592 domain-containing protein [Pontixanthobacter aquaemixtae]MXO91185.1 DUF3592 domain-containing protein [Pontixanthobacter aquaemixtae]
MVKAKLLIGRIFMPMGMVFASIGIGFLWSDLQLAEVGMRSEGSVIDLSRSRNSDSGDSYRPVVAFYDEDGTRHEFVGQVGSNPSSHSRGDAVTVIYDPAEPGDAMIDGFMDRFLLPVIFIGMGSLFALIGGGLMLAVWRRRKIIAQLKRSGIPIMAEFIECYRDNSTKVNGRSPYRVVAQATHPVTGTLQSFKSDPVWIDLSRQLAGERVTVLVDPVKPKRSYIDLSEFVGPDEQA